MDEQIKKILGEVFGVDPNLISDESRPDTIEEWDSMSHIVMATALEEHFGIELSASEIIEMDSVATIKLILGNHGVKV